MDAEGARRGGGARRVLAVLAVALGVRVAVGVWRGPELLEAGNGLDYMRALATSLARGGGYAIDGVPHVFQQPGYVACLAAGFALLGATWQGALLANALLGTALAGMTYRLAGRLDARAALPAGIVAAVHPVLVWHGNAVADTTLFALALVGWADAALGALRGGLLRHTLCAGLWIAVAFLTRPSLLPLLPVAPVALLAVSRSWRKALAFAALSSALAFVLVLPWLLRNHALTGVFPLVGTHGPESVWAANTDESPEATERDSSYDAVSALHAGTEFDVQAFQTGVTPREGVRREALFRDATRTWIREHFGTFLHMYVVRLGRIADLRYHPSRHGTRPIPHTRLRSLVNALSYGPVLLLAIAGTVLLVRGPRRAEALTLVAVVALYALTHAVGAGYTRVRVPVDPLLVALAGVALARFAAGGAQRPAAS